MRDAPGLVDQLQADALNQSVPVTTLLRKVKVAATKLGLDDALEWVEGELNGYRLRKDTPPYRMARGTTIALNPYHGWQPIQFGDANLANAIGQVSLGEPIGNYEAILASEGGNLTIDLPNETIAALNEALSYSVPRVANQFGRGVIVAIVQRVRDMVLDWALELARAGITGEGLSFTSAEKERASVAQISIGEFHGSFNTGHADRGGRIEQSTRSHQTTNSADIFDGMIQALERSSVKDAEKHQLVASVDAMRNAPDKAAFLDTYRHFMNAAADHMTIVRPFLPALASLLS